MTQPVDAPIRSMTGFGVAAAARDGLTARVEIRAVNHRGRKVNVRSRPGLGPFEKQLRDRIGAALHRGAIDVFVTVVRPIDEAHLPVDMTRAQGIVAALRRLKADLNLAGELEVGDLAAVPSLFEEGVEAPLEEKEWPAVEEALNTAIAQVLTMREVEGRITAGRLADLAAPIEAFAVRCRAAAPAVVERVRQRLQARIDEIRPDGKLPADEAAIEREVCFFADKADINEELDRLQSHLHQFRQALAQGGEIGKQVEFLAQEFLREVNTTASKANDPEIVTGAIDAKLAVEKIKEQAANLE